MIRKAKLSDVPAIVELSVESVSRNPIPVRIDREAMADTVREALSKPNDFIWVSEIDGEVVGAVGGQSGPSFWHERLVFSVMVYFVRSGPDGLALLRELMRFIKSRPAIKVAIMELEPESDPRLIKFMKRLGMGRQATSLSYVRGMQ